MKKCKICGKEKRLEDFFKNKRMPDGRLNYCRICCKAYNHNNYEKLKDKYGFAPRRGIKMDVAKEVFDRFNRSCSMCGYGDNLIIHHIDGNGRSSVTGMNNSLDNLQLLCSDCHSSYHGKEGARKRWGELR